MPNTLHLQASRPEDVARAAELLRAGRLVAFATETVYGLGADATSPEAVAGIFAAKGRPHWDPLIVHLAEVSDLERITRLDRNLAGRVATLAARFWPGPLTLLLPRTEAIPDAVTAGRPLVGVRVPAHPAARLLLQQAGVPVAAPSANRFGHTSPTTAEHVLADLDGRIHAVLDAGACAIGVESTVLDPTQTPMVIYRPGAVSAADLEGASGMPVTTYSPAVAEVHGQEQTALPSPGVGLRHYAPRARLLLVEGTPAAWKQAIARMDAEAERGHGSCTGVLLPRGWEAGGAAVVEPWADWEDPEALAAELFRGLRRLDELGAESVLCPLPGEAPGITAAVRDRLIKAARPA